MTEQEINIAVAEELGWKYHVYWWQSPSGDSRTYCPPFTTSLDACAEFEKTLNSLEKITYMDRITVLVATHYNHGYSVFDMITATPLQRCEAFLRVKSKWKP